MMRLGNQTSGMWRLLLTLIVTGLLAAGCGGGGGTASTLEYTGETALAAITQTNGTSLSTSAYANGTSGAEIGSVLASAAPVAAPPSSGPGEPLLVRASDFLQKRLAELNIGQVASEGTSRTSMSLGPLPGDCGGTMSWTITLSNETSFNGSMNFSRFDDCSGGTVSGSVVFSGAFNPTTEEFGQVTMTAHAVAMTDSDGTYTLEGTMTAASTGVNTVQITSNMLVQDPAGRTYKMENYVVTVVQYPTQGYEEISVNGVFYHPDHGRIVVVATGLVVYDGEDWPRSGTIVITGRTNCSATLTAQSTTYSVDVDEDGDGTADATDAGNWIDL